MMTCERATSLLGAYVDGELDASAAAVVSEHIAACRLCARQSEEIRDINHCVRTAEPQALPPGLADRVFQRVAHADAERNRQTSHRGGWLKQAASIIVACGLTAAATSAYFVAGGHSQSLERDILQAHVRSLLQDNPIQIASSDSHQVRPWFAGRLDVAPVVPDLEPAGFTLVGGRMDLVGQQRAATIVYKRAAHIVNVFAWASDEHEMQPRRLSLNGFNCVAWSRKGVYYWAVSDLEVSALMELARLM